MKTFLKFALGFVAVLLAAIAVTLFILHRMYPPEKIQALVLQKLQTALRREIRLSRADLGWRGLTLEGLEVSEVPDFKAGTILKVQVLWVFPSLPALIQRRIELSDVLLVGWECRVVRRANGSWNFESPAGSTQAAAKAQSSPKAAAPAGALASAWNIGRLQLKEGTIRYSDNVSHAAYALTNIQILTKRLRPKGTFPVDLSMDYEGGGLEGQIDLRGSADLGALDPAKMSVQWDSLKLRHLGLELASSGQVSNLSAPELSAKASIPKQRLNARDASQWPQWLPLVIPSKAEVKISKAGNRVDVKKAQITLSSLRADIQGQVQLKDKGSPDVHLQIKTGDFSLADMAEFLPPGEAVRPTGKGNVQIRADGPADAPALSGQAVLQGAAFAYEGQSLSGLAATAGFSPQAISAEAQGTLNRGAFQISLNARDYRAAPDVQVKGQLSELDLERLSKAPSLGGGSGAKPQSQKSAGAAARAASAPVHTSGQFTIDKIVHPNFTASRSTFAWDLRNANVPSRITGSARLNVGPGRFDDLQSLAAAQGGLVQALLLPITILQKATSLFHIPLLPSFDRVNFKAITGDYIFQNGVMTIRESHLDSDAAYVTATGTADMGRQTLNMHISTKLLLKQLASPIGFKVGGTFDHPSVRPDVTSILQQPAVQKTINQGLEQGRKLLENIFK